MACDIQQVFHSYEKCLYGDRDRKELATTPLRGVVYLGLIITFISFAYGINIFMAALKNPLAARTGYSSIMIVMLFLGGVIITILGMIGEYLARIYMEVKNRPIYFERETNICKKEDSKE